MRGAKNPFWRGGHDHYKGPNWYRQRAAARKRDGYRCLACGIDEAHLRRALDVDHIIPFAAFNDYRIANRLLNLRSLCHPCHMKLQDRDPSLPRFARLL